MPLPNVTVVIPVYNQFPALAACVSSLRLHLPPRHRIVILDDASTEDRFGENVRALIVDMPHARYERNSENLGFPGTCNRAVREFSRAGDDILLLNADTVVTEGWLDEMQQCLYACDRHGVCCPRSNDATILTFPRSCGDGCGAAEDSYACWNALKEHLPRFARIPTGVGFCMLIRRGLIDRFCLFDESYGRGYHEENDFCCRINRFGYSVVAANRAYVFHHQAYSFSREEKRMFDEKNGALLQRRYPEYRRELAEFHGWYEDAVEHFADILGGCAARRRILIDLSHLSAAHNGTSEYALCLLRHLVPLLEAACETHVLVDKSTAAFFGIERAYRFFWTGQPVPLRFDLAFAPLQIFDIRQIVALNTIALRIVCTLHDVISLRCHYLKSAEREGAERLTVRHADGIIAVSQTAVDDLSSYVGQYCPPLVPRRMRVVYHGHDNRGRMGTPPRSFERKIGKGFVLLVGNAFEHKAVREALAHVPGEYRVVVLGGKAHRYGRRRNTAYLRSGFLSEKEIHGLYERSLAVLFPSQYEGFGLPILHAASHGKCVIAQAGPASEEITQTFGLQKYVLPFARFGEIGALLGQAAARTYLPPFLSPRSWADAARDTADFLLGLLNGPVDIPALSARFRELKIVEYEESKTQARNPYFRLTRNVGKKLDACPRVKRSIKRALLACRIPH